MLGARLVVELVAHRSGLGGVANRRRWHFVFGHGSSSFVGSILLTGSLVNDKLVDITHKHDVLTLALGLNTRRLSGGLL